MPRRLTPAQRNAKLDDQQWEASLAFVRAYNEWQTAHKAYGPYSIQSRDSYKVALKALQTYKRLDKKR